MAKDEGLEGLRELTDAGFERVSREQLRAILEQAGQVLTFDDLAALAKRLGIKGESGESARMIREDRDDPRR